MVAVVGLMHLVLHIYLSESVFLDRRRSSDGTCIRTTVVAGVPVLPVPHLVVACVATPARRALVGVLNGLNQLSETLTGFNDKVRI